MGVCMITGRYLGLEETATHILRLNPLQSKIDIEDMIMLKLGHNMAW